MVDSNENEHTESGEIVPELISQIAKLRKSVKRCEVLQEELDTLCGSFLEKSLEVRSLQEQLDRTAKSEFFNFKTKNKNTTSLECIFTHHNFSQKYGWPKFKRKS